MIIFVTFPKAGGFVCESVHVCLSAHTREYREHVSTTRRHVILPPQTGHQSGGRRQSNTFLNICDPVVCMEVISTTPGTTDVTRGSMKSLFMS